MDARGVRSLVALVVLGFAGLVGTLADEWSKPAPRPLATASVTAALSSEPPTEYDVAVVFKPEVPDSAIGALMSSLAHDPRERAVTDQFMDYEHDRALVTWRRGATEGERQVYLDRLTASGLVARVEHR